jgi:hypothetical protein
MTRNDLKEIITEVIKKMGNNSPVPACGWLWADQPVVTTYYAVGEEDPAPTPKPTTKYAIGEEDVVTTKYAIGEEG